MTRTRLIIFCFIYQTFSFAQSDSISSYIKRLDNSQFEPQGSFIGWRIQSNSPARQSLYKIGDPASDALIKALLDSTKFVMAHLTLADIYQEKNQHMSIAWDSLTKRTTVKLFLSDTLQLFAYERYRGLNKRPSYYPDEDNIKKIILFWQRRRLQNDRSSR